MTEQPYIGKWISCLYRIGQSFYDHIFAEYGIGSGHYACLICLYRQEGITQDEISKRLFIDKATITRAILKLESLGYVERKVDTSDRRAYRVFITPKGRTLEPIVKAGLKNWAQSITEGFSPEQTSTAYQLVEKMALNAIQIKATLKSQGGCEVKSCE